MLTRKEVDLWGFDAGEYRDTAQQLYEELDEARRLLRESLYVLIPGSVRPEERQMRDRINAFLRGVDDAVR